MSRGFERINQAAQDEAESLLKDCCGSWRWAKLMAVARPFRNEHAVTETAARIWNELEPVDWQDAFWSHPMIGGGPNPAQKERSANWSVEEQAGMDFAGEALQNDLAAANREYYAKFGYIFIVCAMGKTAEEMLANCRARLSNDPETEMHTAAAEQQKITEIRLMKLLSQ